MSAHFLPEAVVAHLCNVCSKRFSMFFPHSVNKEHISEVGPVVEFKYHFF